MVELEFLIAFSNLINRGKQSFDWISYINKVQDIFKFTLVITLDLHGLLKFLAIPNIPRFSISSLYFSIHFHEKKWLSKNFIYFFMGNGSLVNTNTAISLLFPLTKTNTNRKFNSWRASTSPDRKIPNFVA